MFPGELENAFKKNCSLEHLEIESDNQNGHKVICKAKDKSVCDNGYKPLDCMFYPLFPISVDKDNRFMGINALCIEKRIKRMRQKICMKILLL